MLKASTRHFSASILCVIFQTLCPAWAQEDQGDALCRQAFPYLEQKRYDEASRILWKAASVAPNNANVQYNLGVAFAGLKRDRDAWTAFAKAGQLDPTDVKTQIAIAKAYAKCGDKKNGAQVLIDCQRKLRPDPDEQKEIVLLLAHFSEGKAVNEKNCIILLPVVSQDRARMC